MIQSQSLSCAGPGIKLSSLVLTDPNGRGEMILPEGGIMLGWPKKLMPILVRLDWASSVVREGMSRGAPSCPLCELWSELRK